MRHFRQQSGFTIIEITLFVAMTGLMLIVAFSAISGRVDSVQFTDSMRSLEAYLNKQLQSVDTGLNLRADNTDCSVTGTYPNFGAEVVNSGTTSRDFDCVVNGRDLTFSKNGVSNTFIDEAVIVSPNKTHQAAVLPLSAEPQVEEGELLEKVLSDADATASLESGNNYTFEWGATVSSIEVNGNPHSNVYLRHIRSQISPQTYLLYSVTEGTNFSILDSDIKVCMLSADENRRAAFFFQPNKAIRFEIQPGEEVCG